MTRCSVCGIIAEQPCCDCGCTIAGCVLIGECARDKEAKAKPLREATHGWRNPPSVYEEDRSET